MKLFRFLSVLFGIAILITACGGSSSTTATPTTGSLLPTQSTPVSGGGTLATTPEMTTAITPTQATTQEMTSTTTTAITPTTAAPVASGAQTVVRLSGWSSSPSETALLQSLLYQFQVANPNIIVKYEPITGDYRQAMLTALSSGTEPDVFYVDSSYYADWAKKGVLMQLDDLMASSGVSKDMFIKSVMDSYVVDGKVYGIPKDFNTLGLFYNKDMFDKAGVKYPTDSWTWDDLKNAAQKLTNLSDSKKPIYGFCTPPDAGRFPVFVIQNGGTIMKPDFSDTTVDDQKAIDAATFYTDFRKNKIGGIPADMGEGWQGTLFGKGQCAMVYEGGWLIPYMTQSWPAVQYGVARLPAGPAGKGNMIFSVSWSMSANTKVKDAAWKVINFLTSEQSQKTVLESGFALPTRQSLQTSDYFKNNANSQAIFNGAYDNAVPFYWGPASTDVNDQIGKALERVFLQNQAVADSMKQAAQAIRDAIAAAK